MQDSYEVQLNKLGLKSDKSFTCACYFDEVGNTPKKGDILSWAEIVEVVIPAKDNESDDHLRNRLLSNDSWIAYGTP